VPGSGPDSDSSTISTMVSKAEKGHGIVMTNFVFAGKSVLQSDVSPIVRRFVLLLQVAAMSSDNGATLHDGQGCQMHEDEERRKPSGSADGGQG